MMVEDLDRQLKSCKSGATRRTAACRCRRSLRNVRMQCDFPRGPALLPGEQIVRLGPGTMGDML